MAAMVTLGRAASPSRARRNRPPISAALSGPANSSMSAPAAKMRSPPHTTTAPGGSASSSPATAPSWRSSSTDSAFILGRSRRMRATPSGRRSTDTNDSAMRRATLAPRRSAALAGGAQNPLGRGVGIALAGHHLAQQSVELVALAGLVGALLQAARHDGADLGLQPAGAPPGQE